VVWTLGAPAGIIAVKTPGLGVFDSELIAGQMLDYLLRLQSFHGLEWVFGISLSREVFTLHNTTIHVGILTTYEEWRIFWLPNTAAWQNAEVKPPPAEVPPLPFPGMPTWDGTAADVDEDFEVPPSPSSREIHASKLYRYDEKKLADIIASVLHKMASSPRRAISLEVRYCCICIVKYHFTD